jgi:CheY-like chemotaxis protein
VEPRRKATLVILVVDDSLTVREAVREAFQPDDGVRVLACGDVDAAEALLARESPDVVLCDVVLPGRSGYELCAALKDRPEPGRVPVLLLTGAFEPFDSRRAEEAGADAIVSKPFTLSEIRELVQHAVRPRRQPPQDAAAAGHRDRACTVTGAADGDARRHPEITEADLVEAPPAAGEETETPTDRLARRLVEPLSRRLADPVARNLAHRLLESEPVREMTREAIRSAAERLVRQRLEELECDPASSRRKSGPDDRAG